MREKILILRRSLEHDQKVVDRLFEQLAGARLDADSSDEDKIVVGYRLHNLYNIFENMFRNIAKTLENQLDDSSGWHAELLRRMELDVRPIRPAVVDAETFARLDELRGFRHVFRSLYGVELDAARMTVALDKAHQLRRLWPDQLAAFLRFLDEILAADEPDG